MSQQIGFAAEEQVREFLLKQGMKSVVSNYSCKMGEIDLVMKDGACIVFIEVRARTSTAYGGALASVTSKKQQKLIKTALFYLKQNKLNHDYPVRFDVVSLEGRPYKINWVKNAFGTDF